MKNTFHKATPKPKKTGSEKNGSVDTIEQQRLSKKEKLQRQTQAQKAIDELKSGQDKLLGDLKKIQQGNHEEIRSFKTQLQGVQEEADRQSRLLETLAQQQKSQGFALREKATIQEAMERSDLMYRQLLAVSRGLVESSEKNGSNATQLAEKMLDSLEEMRKHLKVLVSIKTDINLKPDEIRRIVEPVSEEMKRYVDSSLQSLNSQTTKTLETNLSQTFSEYTESLEQLVQRQESAAVKAEQAAVRAEQAVADQELTRGWQSQALKTLGALGLQATTVLIVLVVVSGSIGALFGFSNRAGYTQWLWDFGNQGIVHGVIATLLWLLTAVIGIAVLIAGYRIVDKALQEQLGENAVKNLWRYGKLSWARRKGDEAYIQALKTEAEQERQEEVSARKQGM